MTKYIKFFLKFLTVIVILVSIGIFSLNAFFSYFCSSVCRNEILSSTNIDGTNLKIIVFERDCGATTDFSTQASIIPAKAQLSNEGGNIFRADTNHGTAPTGPGGGPVLRVSVTGPGNIELSYHLGTRIFLAESKFKQVYIKYSLITDR